MSGGETDGVAGGGISSEPRGPPNESEQVMDGLDEGEEDIEDIEEEGLKARKAEDSKAEAVLEKAGQQER